jgi:6-phosphogluconolactonase (cycloisomerase 2 family)
MDTDADGAYLFADLVPNAYYLEFDLPSGYVFTGQGQGGDATVDSDVNPATQRTETVFLPSGTNDMTWDVGVYDISGQVSPNAVCVMPNTDGTYTAHFSYNNSSDTAVTIPVGTNNFVSPGEANQGQPISFQAGATSDAWYESAFAVTFDGSPLTWTVAGASATASSDTTICSYRILLDEEWIDAFGSVLDNPPAGLNPSFSIEAVGSQGTATCTYVDQTLDCVYKDLDGNVVDALYVEYGTTYVVEHSTALPPDWSELNGIGTYGVNDLVCQQDTCTHLVKNVGSNNGSPFVPVCMMYGVDDQGSRDSQLFRLDLISGSFEMLGSLYKNYDIEGLAIHPSTKELYAVGGEDIHATRGYPQYPQYNGSIYKVNKSTGELTWLGQTGHDDQRAASFNPSTAELWVAVQNQGWMTIQFDASGNVAGSTVEVASTVHNAVRDANTLAWNPDGTALYTVESGTNGKIYYYNPDDGSINQHACSTSQASNRSVFYNVKPYGLEFDQQGNLIATLYTNSTTKVGVRVVNLTTCEYKDEVRVIDAMSSSKTDLQSVAFDNTCEVLAPPSVPASLTVVKDVQAVLSSAPNQMAFDFNVNNYWFTLKDTESKTFDNALPGTYTIAEFSNIPSTERNWQMTGAACVDQNGDSVDADVDLVAMSATVDVWAGQNVTCTFINEFSDFEAGAVTIQKVFLPLILK